MTGINRGRHIGACTARWLPVLERLLAEHGMSPRHLTVYAGTPRTPLSAATHGMGGEH